MRNGLAGARRALAWWRRRVGGFVSLSLSQTFKQKANERNGANKKKKKKKAVENQ